MQQHVEDIGVRLFDLVEQHHAVGATAYSLGELAAFVVAHIARGRTDEPAHRELLHVFGHVNTHHRPVVVEQVLGHSTGKLGLANTGWPEEHKRADRAIGIAEPSAASADGM